MTPYNIIRDQWWRWGIAMPVAREIGTGAAPINIMRFWTPEKCTQVLNPSGHTTLNQRYRTLDRRRFKIKKALKTVWPDDFWTKISLSSNVNFNFSYYIISTSNVGSTLFVRWDEVNGQK